MDESNQQLKEIVHGHIFGNSISPEHDLAPFDDGTFYNAKVRNATGYPVAYGSVKGYKEISYNYGYSWQEFRGHDAERTYYKYALSNTEWSEWEPIATNNKIEIPFPFNTGYVQEGEVYKCRLVINKSLRTCRLYLSVRKSDGTAFANLPQTSVGIGTLPLAYRPITSFLTPISPTSAGLVNGGGTFLVVSRGGLCNLYVGNDNSVAFFTTIEWDY